MQQRAQLLKCQTFQKCVSFEVTSEQQDLCPHVKLRRKRFDLHETLWICRRCSWSQFGSCLFSLWLVGMKDAVVQREAFCTQESSSPVSDAGTQHIKFVGCFFCFVLFCVTTGSRGAIYKCHPSNTFCTHVATCHPTPTSLLHCGNSPVTGIFLAKFRWNTADPIWALQMICVITLPVLQQTVIWTFSACGFNVTQSCIFTETDSHWWPLCQIRGRRLSVFFQS